MLGAAESYERLIRVGLAACTGRGGCEVRTLAIGVCAGSAGLTTQSAHHAHEIRIRVACRFLHGFESYIVSFSNSNNGRFRVKFQVKSMQGLEHD